MKPGIVAAREQVARERVVEDCEAIGAVLGIEAPPELIGGRVTGAPDVQDMKRLVALAVFLDDIRQALAALDGDV